MMTSTGSVKSLQRYPTPVPPNDSSNQPIMSRAPVLKPCNDNYCTDTLPLDSLNDTSN